MKIHKHFTHRTSSDLILTFFKMLNRNGLSTKKIRLKLKLYLDILKQYGVTPTFPITAIIVKRHPELIKKLSKERVEFAIHGYDHLDYSQLPLGQTLQHLDKAFKIFKQHNILPTGHRFPYLKFDSKCINILTKYPVEWDSSYSILWDVIDREKFNKRNWMNYQSMLSHYNYSLSSTYISVPRFLYNKIVEIPVSLPDDDLLTDRLGIKDEKILSQIWGEILRKTFSRGELFTLQLHPQRISFYKETLTYLIRTARSSNPKIWLTTLGTIAEWWNKKRGFSVEIKKKANDEYQIDAHCPKAATILVKEGHSKNFCFFNGYTLIDSNSFVIRSSRRPIIGISKNCSTSLIEFLKNEGFMIEIGNRQNNYSIFLDGFESFKNRDEREILRKIDSSHFPLIRFWRWPYGYRSALAITGDIDALTYPDFFHRFFYR